jgi:HSP90 family molecular chaperone
MFKGVRAISQAARARNAFAKQATVARFSIVHRSAPLSATMGLLQTKAGLCRTPAGALSGSTIRSMSSGPQTMDFQAETRKLLDIVTHSIYTDKEVFLRELISNASDALEKYRYKQVTGEVSGSDVPLEINIYTDDKRKTLTIVDNGVGMTRDELISNLGTIARSGSKQFVEALKGGEATPAGGNKTAAEGIIGQFGVGFYSSFMVSDSVAVESLSATEANATAANKWSSDGSGQFTVDAVSPEDTAEHLVAKRGSRITMQLKESCAEYADAEKIKRCVL